MSIVDVIVGHPFAIGSVYERRRVQPKPISPPGPFYPLSCQLLSCQPVIYQPQFYQPTCLSMLPSSACR
jgi:hypothetical protein